MDKLSVFKKILSLVVVVKEDYSLSRGVFSLSVTVEHSRQPTGGTHVAVKQNQMVQAKEQLRQTVSIQT